MRLGCHPEPHFHEEDTHEETILISGMKEGRVSKGECRGGSRTASGYLCTTHEATCNHGMVSCTVNGCGRRRKSWGLSWTENCRLIEKACALAPCHSGPQGLNTRQEGCADQQGGRAEFVAVLLGFLAL